MIQIIYEVAAIGCCIYTGYRFCLYLYGKLHPDKKRIETVFPVRTSIPSFGEGNGSALQKTEKALDAYRYRYLQNNSPVSNRVQVYIDRKTHDCIRRFLSATAPDVSMSGFVNKIVAEHLDCHREEIDKIYNEQKSKLF